ncbi:uncharacterized protein [Coffea arabica]|uniref:Isomerase BH0283-like n=1 Tax=Coffea arabica TaxID=13443 RepID=A0A6P6V2Y0_COFAR|nr:uncharacterized protein LOC113716802 [Coffea arabica]
MARKPVKFCVVDAFADQAFKGNPAAVCVLEDDKDEEWMQSVATEFNISETCYLTRIVDSDSQSTTPRFKLRWFTPVAEVKLCGHATLAASYFLFSYGLVNSDKIEFLTLSGILTAKKVPDSKTSNSMDHQNGDIQEDYFVELDFPVVPIAAPNSAEISEISKSLNGASVVEIHKTTTEEDLLVVLPSGKAVVEAEPLFDEIKRCPGRGLIITGPAPPESGFDFYSRFFCPKYGINEDPVCGSAHCALAPYWSKKLGKCDFVAYQASPRSGVLHLHVDEKNQRVLLRGKAVVVTEGSILV